MALLIEPRSQTNFLSFSTIHDTCHFKSPLDSLLKPMTYFSKNYIASLDFNQRRFHFLGCFCILFFWLDTVLLFFQFNEWLIQASAFDRIIWQVLPNYPILLHIPTSSHTLEIQIFQSRTFGFFMGL